MNRLWGAIAWTMTVLLYSFIPPKLRRVASTVEDQTRYDSDGMVSSWHVLEICFQRKIKRV